MPAQYEYKFVRVEIAWKFLGEFDTDYIDVIRENALSGWRFVQALAPTNKWGVSRFCDLIFERKIE